MNIKKPKTYFLNKIKNNSRGVSVIETSIIISVLVIIGTFGIPQFLKIKERQAVNNAASTIVTALNKASSQTLASVNSYQYGVRFSESSIIIFRGTSYAGSTVNETINLISPATITNVTLNGVSSIPGEMYFNRLTNLPSKTGTITIYSPSFSKTVTIGATGQVSTN